MEKTVAVGFNEQFKEANETRCRYRVMKGTAGSGKSVNVAQDYIIKLQDPLYKGINLMVVRATEDSNQLSTFSELTGAIERFGLSSLWRVTTNPMRLKCKVTGNEIVFRGCNDTRAIERIKSVSFRQGKLCWIWIEEATEITSKAFDILDDRLRGILDNAHQYYQITLTFNPINAQHWIKHQLWDMNSPDIFTHSSTYLKNRWCDEAYKARMERRKLTDPEGYKVYGLGEWGNAGDNILSNYTIETVDKDITHYDAVLQSQDFGFTHANCILQVGYKDGDMYILKEIYEHDKYTNKLIEQATVEGFSKHILMYCDSAEPDRIAEWRNNGWRAYAVHKNPGSVAAQIDYLRGRKIHVDTACIGTAKEIQQWRWKRTSNGELTDEPLEVEDDAMAALRYATEPYRRKHRMRTMTKQSLGL
jgi:phage terminase large subunit